MRDPREAEPSPAHGATGGETDPAREATRILRLLTDADAAPGDAPLETERLLELVYGELRRLAARFLEVERADHTLQPTALVHEAYLRLIREDRTEWKGRTHFLAVAAGAMRRILVDHARTKGRAKRGGAWRRVELEAEVAPAARTGYYLLALDATLERLGAVSERQARIVELRFFGGLPVEAVAEVLGLSRRTVVREWRFAKAWLAAALAEEEG